MHPSFSFPSEKGVDNIILVEYVMSGSKRMLIAGFSLTLSVGGMRGQGFNVVSQLEAMSAVVAVGKIKNTALSDSNTLLCLTMSVTILRISHSVYVTIPFSRKYKPDTQIKCGSVEGAFMVFSPAHTEMMVNKETLFEVNIVEAFFHGGCSQEYDITFACGRK